MALDPEKKAELVERLKLARQKKVEMKKVKENTETKKPIAEVAEQSQGDTLTNEPKVIPFEEPLPLPKPDKKDKPIEPEIATKNKFMKVVYYSEPSPKILQKMATIFDDESDNEQPPPKLRNKAKANPPKTPKIKPKPEPVLDYAEERRAYLKQLANMYF
jgi:hypothetical protein